MSEPLSVKISGKMTIGEGKGNSLFAATPITPYGDKSKIDILLSAEGRHVRLEMDRRSILDLIEKIQKVLF